MECWSTHSSDANVNRRTSGPTRRSTKGQWTPEEVSVHFLHSEQVKSQNFMHSSYYLLDVLAFPFCSFFFTLKLFFSSGARGCNPFLGWQLFPRFYKVIIRYLIKKKKKDVIRLEWCYLIWISCPCIWGIGPSTSKRGSVALIKLWWILIKWNICGGFISLFSTSLALWHSWFVHAFER